MVRHRAGDSHNLFLSLVGNPLFHMVMALLGLWLPGYHISGCEMGPEEEVRHTVVAWALGYLPPSGCWLLVL